MDLNASYKAHVEELDERTTSILRKVSKKNGGYRGIVFAAGGETLYHADDQPVPFKPSFHFARWAPVKGPDHLLVFRPQEVPLLVRVVPRDYWYETPTEIEHPYPRTLCVETVADVQAAVRAVGKLDGFAYVGPDSKMARALGIPAEDVEPEELMMRLDWDRGSKTAYEIDCIRGAVRKAARGHSAVRGEAEEGHSERAMHACYLAATEHLEHEVPYTNIIAWNEHSAVLHYQSKEVSLPSATRNLLIDAGATVYGYASDITRTYPQAAAHRVFRELVTQLDLLQRELVEGVGPGRSYLELHETAHRGVAKILCDLAVLKVNPEEAFDQGLTDPFFPHGLGHHLGLQVHDVGGRQESPSGGYVEPPARHAYLRTTRAMATGQVLTIEPGIYFIAMLLEPFRQGERASAFNWKLIDELLLCGGARIEDDILCTASGRENLSRGSIPGHLD